MATYLESINLQSIPKGHWGKDKKPNISNHKIFYTHLGIKLGYTKPEDWYNISKNHIKDFGGAGFLGVYYEGSAIQFVKSMNTEYEYKDWLFSGQVPQGYWNDVKNVRLYLEWLYNIMGFTSDECWYKLRQDDLFKNHGRGLYSKYNCSILSILNSAYPDMEWLPWLFAITTNGTWNDIDNHKKYILWLADKLGISTPEGWYIYGAKIIEENRGSGLINNNYKGSINKLLKVAYPDFDFIMYKFNQSPNGYWNDSNNIKNYLEDLFKHKRFTEITDWYSITYQDFLDFYGNGLLDRYGSCYKKLLMDNIEYDWDDKEFVKAGYSKKGCNFLDRLSIAISMQISHKLNTGEHKIDGTKYRADGYLDYNGRCVIIEYNGCCYHGCSKCYPNDCEKTFFSSKTYKECRDYTDKRKLDIQSKGYIVIDIWECEDLPSLDLKSWFENKIILYIPLINIAKDISDNFILQPSKQKYNKQTSKKILVKRERN